MDQIFLFHFFKLKTKISTKQILHNKKPLDNNLSSCSLVYQKIKSVQLKFMQKIIRQLREMKCFARSTAPSCYIVLGCFSNVIFLAFWLLTMQSKWYTKKKAKIKYESALLNDYVNGWRWVLKIKMGLFKLLLQDRHICINDNYFLF